MRKNPFVFLRATYYRWARRIEKICPELVDAPSALCVGDIHLENFGTWRDDDGRWVWGVNDFDEAAVMPYAFDLVRLTASVELAKMKIDGGDAADAILEGYRRGLGAAGTRLLDEQGIWIRDYVKCSDEFRHKFWNEVDKLTTADPPPAIRKLLVGSLPGKKAEDAAFFSRVAGGGSLGRPRFVVVATWRGGRVVREAKALVPSAWNWAHGTTPRQHKYLELSTGAYRAPDPFLHVDRDTDDRDFVFRRLSADSRKIELDKDAVADLKLELLRAMGSDLASIHAATPDASKPIATDLKARGSRWLHDAARAAREATEKDFEAWGRQ